MMLIYYINTFYCHPDHAEHDFSRLWKKLDKYIDLEELNYKFNDDNKKHEVLARVLEYYKKNRKKLKIKHLYNIDGVSVITSHHWFNIRPSNTEPLLRLRIEGKNEKDLLKVKRQIEKLLK
jgi:phosphomannomutase